MLTPNSLIFAVSERNEQMKDMMVELDIIEKDGLVSKEEFEPKWAALASNFMKDGLERIRKLYKIENDTIKKKLDKTVTKIKKLCS